MFPAETVEFGALKAREEAPPEQALGGEPPSFKRLVLLYDASGGLSGGGIAAGNAEG